MTWALTAVSRDPHPTFPNLFMRVTMTFGNFDAQGVSQSTHVYTEPNVADVSTTGIGRLVRDQLRQLNLLVGFSTGAVADLTAIKAVQNGLALPDAVVATIAASVPDWTKVTNAQVANAANTTQVANPVTAAPLVTPAYDPAALITALSPTAKASLAVNPNTPTIRNDLRARDGHAVMDWAAMLLGDGQILQADFDLLQTTCAPVPDPAWTATVSRAVAAVGRALTATDVALVRALVTGA